MNRYRIVSKQKSGFLKPAEIESAASVLLAAYSRRFKVTLAPPVPVDEILESHLGLDLRIDNLLRLTGKRNVLGATWVRQQRVGIDESLDPSLYPAMTGRYRFTLAHEVGHWELHRHLYSNQEGLFTAETQPSIICRSDDKLDPKEWQANQFAGYLLMPHAMVVQAWQDRRGNLEPYDAANEIAELSDRWSLKDAETPTVEIARELAQQFSVSGQAMQIRLVGMGLIATGKSQPSLFCVEPAG